MNQKINQTGGNPTPWPLRYFNPDAGMESGCCGCGQAQMGGGCGCGGSSCGCGDTCGCGSQMGGGCGCAGAAFGFPPAPVVQPLQTGGQQVGGNATPLPMRWFDPNAGRGLGKNCGCAQAGGEPRAGSQPQIGGYAAPWPQPCFNQANTVGADCFCNPPPDFTDMLYRGKCARAVAAGECQIPVSNLQCLPAFYPVPHYPGDPKSAAELIAQERTSVPAQGSGVQAGGGTVGAPFYNDTFGCAKGVPGVQGLSYRFNECGLETGVNFYHV